MRVLVQHACPSVPQAELSLKEFDFMCCTTQMRYFCNTVAGKYDIVAEDAKIIFRQTNC